MLALILVLSLVIGSGSPGADTARARLTVTDTSPFTVRGTGFKPKEHVTLALSAENRLTRVVSADGAGRFTRRVLLFKLDDSCPAYFLRATGSRGSVAVVKVMPECANLQPVDR